MISRRSFLRGSAALLATTALVPPVLVSSAPMTATLVPIPPVEPFALTDLFVQQFKSNALQLAMIEANHRR